MAKLKLAKIKTLLTKNQRAFYNLLRVKDFDLDTSKFLIDKDFVEAVFANCFFSHTDKKWFSMTRDKNIIKESHIQFLDNLVSQGFLEKVIGDQDLKKQTIYKPTKFFFENFGHKQVYCKQDNSCPITFWDKEKNKYIPVKNLNLKYHGLWDLYCSDLSDLDLINSNISTISLPLERDGIENPSMIESDFSFPTRVNLINSRYEKKYGKTIHEYGRLYCLIQNLPSELRKLLWLNGKPTIELDYKEFHPTALYHLNGLPAPKNNCYDFCEDSELSRDKRKVLLNIMINTTGKRKTLNAIAYHCQLSFSDAKVYCQRAESYHKQIIKEFYRGNSKLQNLDGRMAQEILVNFARAQKPIIGIHDSFVVQECDEELLRQQMIFVYEKYISKIEEPKIKKVLKMEICGIYKITNLVDGKFYRGSSNDCVHRWNMNHLPFLKKNTHNNSYLQNAFNLYGEQNFKFEITQWTLPEDQYIIEQKYLDVEWDKQVNCYNVSQFANNPSGFLGQKHTEETKQVLREKNGGKNHWNFGKTTSKETREKISAASKKMWDEDHINNMREKMTGKLSGEKHPRWNKGLKIERIDSNGIIKSYNSAYFAARELKVNHQNIFYWLKVPKVRDGFYWRYAV